MTGAGQQLEERLAEFDALADVMGVEAARRAFRHDLAADAAQEARLAAWRHLEQHPDAPRTHVHHVARQAAWALVNDRVRPTGHPGRAKGGRRKPGIPTVSTWRTTSIDLHEQHHDDTGTRLPAALLVDDHAPTVVDEVAVRHAIAALRPADREHVLLRFWLDMTPAQIAEQLSLTRAQVNEAWRGRIAPRLRVLLADAA